MLQLSNNTIIGDPTIQHLSDVFWSGEDWESGGGYEEYSFEFNGKTLSFDTQNEAEIARNTILKANNLEIPAEIVRATPPPKRSFLYKLAELFIL